MVMGMEFSRGLGFTWDPHSQPWMGAFCFIPWFHRDAMACPNSGSLPRIIYSGAALMGVNTIPLLMVLRRLGRELEKWLSV